MLDIYEFVKLEIDEKAEVIWSDAIFLDSYKDTTTSVNLYFLYGFYVEVTVAENNITEIIPFKQGYRLDKYMDKIVIV